MTSPRKSGDFLWVGAGLGSRPGTNRVPISAAALLAHGAHTAPDAAAPGSGGLRRLRVVFRARTLVHSAPLGWNDRARRRLPEVLDLARAGLGDHVTCSSCTVPADRAPGRPEPAHCPRPAWELTTAARTPRIRGQLERVPGIETELPSCALADRVDLPDRAPGQRLHLLDGARGLSALRTFAFARAVPSCTAGGGHAWERTRRSPRPLWPSLDTFRDAPSRPRGPNGWPTLDRWAV